MKLIRFRRLNSTRWEIAFNESHLYIKLNGDFAEIIMPAKPWYIRLWRKLFPPQPLNKGSENEYYSYK